MLPSEPQKHKSHGQMAAMAIGLSNTSPDYAGLFNSEKQPATWSLHLREMFP